MFASHPLERRIHDRVLQLLGTAMMKAELCEKLADLGRSAEVPPHLAELRASLAESVVELQDIMAELRTDPAERSAHKLKQPLAVAWGFVELLLEDPTCDLAPPAVRYVHEIQASLQTMNEVIDGLQ